MSLRRERELKECRGRRLYEALLALGVAVLLGGLLFAFGVVLRATVLAPRPGPPSPEGFSTLPSASPDPRRP